MDNGSGRRRGRGHAALAAQARRTLGVSETHHLAAVPLPLVHAALGLAACALAFLVRIPVSGLGPGIAASAAIALGTGAGLVLYDRLVYPASIRPGIGASSLPMAAVGAFAILLATTTPLWVRLAAALAAAIVIGVIPYLGVLAQTGNTSPWLRMARDGGGIVVAIPYVLAGAGTDLHLLARAAVVGAGIALVSYDALRLEAESRRACLIGALACAVAVALASLFASGDIPGARAALLLLIWYGVRGAAASYFAGRTGVILILEYLAFAVVALLALAWVASGH